MCGSTLIKTTHIVHVYWSTQGFSRSTGYIRNPLRAQRSAVSTVQKTAADQSCRWNTSRDSFHLMQHRLSLLSGKAPQSHEESLQSMFNIHMKLITCLQIKNDTFPLWPPKCFSFKSSALKSTLPSGCDSLPNIILFGARNERSVWIWHNCMTTTNVDCITFLGRLEPCVTP